MNLDLILYGLIGLTLGLIGVTNESRKSLKDKKNEGWSYTRTKLVISSWGLLIVGVLLIILGLLNFDLLD
jgi:sulfite exporter TauE/SafE